MTVRSEANIGMRKARRKYKIEQIKAAKGNNIKFWQMMQQLIPSGTSIDLHKLCFYG